MCLTLYIQLFIVCCEALHEEDMQPVQKIELPDEEGSYQTMQKSLTELKDLDPFENIVSKYLHFTSICIF
jgi:hypothetical protein